MLRLIRRLACALLFPLCCAAAMAQPPWLEQGHPTAAARAAVRWLSSAGDDGLTPADYFASELADTLAAAEREPLGGERVTAFEDALTAALLRYLEDLHGGRIDPRLVHADYSISAAEREAIARALHEAATLDALAAVVRDATPRIPAYARLRDELARYRKLSDDPAWAAPLPRMKARKLEAGAAWEGLPAVTQRLVALGDLPPGTPPRQVYDDTIQAGVRSFQLRHGLAPDGTLGRATLAQLDVSPGRRAGQIALTMERLRWTPLLGAPRMIVVNVPEFALWAYEIRDGEPRLRLHMRVVVGRALDTSTPLFVEDMRFIEFAPYWNVPYSIAVKELVPRLKRDPGYLRREGFEFVRGNTQLSTAVSSANLEDVLRGRARLRQRPGPRNALGDIKFVFPNDEAIFLHHTSAPGLFERTRRDFSHGCIRVEQPLELASFVLQDKPDWTTERIAAAMQADKPSTVRLSEPVPVVIAYGTALVKDGLMYFFPDIYGHDRTLARALHDVSAERRKAGLPSLRPGR